MANGGVSVSGIGSGDIGGGDGAKKRNNLYRSWRHLALAIYKLP